MKRIVAVVWLAAAGILASTACAAGSADGLETTALGTPPAATEEEAGAKLPPATPPSTDPTPDAGTSSSTSSSGASSSSSGASDAGTSSSSSSSSSGASGSSGASSSASSSGSSGAAGTDCPAGDLNYYLKAITALSGPAPVNCPCNASTCCYGGLVCVPL